MTTRSERLKESRLKAWLSQKQVADAVGMKQPSYSYLEKMTMLAHLYCLELRAS